MSECGNQEQPSVSNQIISSTKANPEQVAKPTCRDTLIRHKWRLVLMMITLAALTILSGLLYYFLQPKAAIIERVDVPMPDSTRFVMLTLKLSDFNLFQPNEEYIAYATYPLEDKKGRLLQTSTSPSYIHFLQQDLGINIRVSPHKNATFFVNQGKFIDYVEKQATTEKKEDKEPLNQNKYTTSTNQFFDDLGSIFTEAISRSGTPNVQVKFANQTLTNIKLNGGFLQFDTSGPKRSLQEENARRLFLGNLLSAAFSIIPKVAGFVFSTVQKYGPIIGKVVGGIAGGVIGGPAGIMTGMQLGETIGGAASSLVSACIPQGSFRISCTPSSVGSVLGQFGGSFMGNMGNFGNFGGFGNMGGFGSLMGGLFNGIPKQALSSFGFGSLFGMG